MSDFFRFPHTPHLAWLGAGSPRGDKVLQQGEADLLLAGELVVEEKLDGANLGFSVDLDGSLRVQNRGQYLSKPYNGQFSRLASWIGMHEQSFIKVLGPNLILFGEWCAARHSLQYDCLPDWFLAFDVYDIRAGKFWSTPRRDELAKETSTAVVPTIFKGKASLSFLESLLSSEQSRFRCGGSEGIVVRKESGDWLESRAKLVRADFLQNITGHWSGRAIQWNRVHECTLPSASHS